MRRSWIGRCAAVATAALLLTNGAWAEEDKTSEDGGGAAQPEAPADSDTSRIEELEKKVDVLASELGKAVADDTLPEEKLESEWGFGPAASKVYRKDRGLSIGGYGEYRVRDFVGGGSQGMATEADALRAVLYVGYKFDDKWLFNSEIEFEHGSTEDNGAVSVEFATVDWQAFENHGMRAGLVLLPMGLINEVHEPTFYYGASRPAVERQVIPTTWREVGGGVFGRFASGRVEYRAYAVNGLNATGFSDSGIRDGRQNGSEALANDWAFVARTDVDVVSGLMLGGSVYVGPSGQGQEYDTGSVVNPVPKTLTTIYELHAEYKAYGLSLRGLFSQVFIGQAGALNAALGNAAGEQIASRMLGAYGEIAYDVMPLVWKNTRASVEPFFRYERLDTQNEMSPSDTANRNYVRDYYTVGLQIKPIENVVFKVDYKNIKPKAGVVANQVEFGLGYVF